METPETEESFDYIDGPLSQLPNLEHLGIDEVDKGVCANSYENRKILRANKYTWIPVYNSDGVATDNIQAISPEMQQDRSRESLSDRKMLLTDVRNKNSDFVTGLDLLLTDEAYDMVPAWVIATTRKWNEVAAERARRGPNEKTYRPSLTGPPSRCKFIKVDGVRCQFWTGGRATDGGYCRAHLSKMHNPEVNPIEHARNRIRSSAGAAASVLENLMDTAVSEPVRLGAAKEILDRAGVRGGVELDVKGELEVVSHADIVRQRIEKLRQGALERDRLMAAHAAEKDADASTATVAEIEYAEVVDDDN